MKQMFFLILLTCSVVIYGQNDKGIKLSGNWGYQIDYSQQNVRITGTKIENSATEGKSGTVKLSLYLTTTKYTGNSITGYALIDYQLDQIQAGYYYHDINRAINFNVNPPSGIYYVTLLLMEYTTSGFIIKDYLNFDDMLAFNDRRTERILNSVATGLNSINNSLNNYNNTNNTPPPSNNNSTLQLKQKRCTSCEGTGHIDGYVASYGSLDEKWCAGCNKMVSATHCHGCKTCPVCNGKGYTESY